jgi:leader peptidase (prepilin peptidase) / N-methyltransferase
VGTVAVVIAASGLLGLMFGSFANVPIHRWPRGGTVSRPRTSACPSCEQPIAARDNVPVVSWLLLRGRCRNCQAPIHWRYPLVELATAILFAAMAAIHGWTGILPALLVIAWSMVVGVAIDLEFRIIPNRMTYPLAPLMLALVTLAAVLDGGAWSAWRTAVYAGLAVPAAMLTFSLLFEWLRGKPGIGMGDIKWAPSLALPVAYVGDWMGVVIWFYGTIISAGVIAIILVAAGKAKMASRIPYGPYLALGAVLAILARDPIGAWIDTRILGL